MGEVECVRLRMYLSAAEGCACTPRGSSHWRARARVYMCVKGRAHGLARGPGCAWTSPRCEVQHSLGGRQSPMLNHGVTCRHLLSVPDSSGPARRSWRAWESGTCLMPSSSQQVCATRAPCLSSLWMGAPLLLGMQSGAVMEEKRAAGGRRLCLQHARPDAVGRACTRLAEAEALCLFALAEVGVEKPNRCIFEAALEALGVQPEEAVHVGDDRCACNLEVCAHAFLRRSWSLACALMHVCRGGEGGNVTRVLLWFASACVMCVCINSCLIAHLEWAWGGNNSASGGTGNSFAQGPLLCPKTETRLCHSSYLELPRPPATKGKGDGALFELCDKAYASCNSPWLLTGLRVCMFLLSALLPRWLGMQAWTFAFRCQSDHPTFQLLIIMLTSLSSCRRNDLWGARDAG